MLSKHGVVDRDGIGDHRDLMLRCPAHVVKLVALVGERERLNLHHSHALHGGAKATAKVMVGAGLSGEGCFWYVDAEIFVAVPDRQFLDQVHWMQEIKSPPWHGKHEFLCACAGHRHRVGTIRGIVRSGLTAFKPATHALDGTLNFFVREGTSQEVLHEFLGNGVRFALADRGGDVFAPAGGDVNGLNLATTLGKLEAHQHQCGFTRTLVPSRNVDKEISSGVSNGGVVAVDDGWERKDVVVGIENQRITVHAFQEVGVIHAFGMVEKDVVNAHGLVVGERHKFVRTVDGHHTERGSKRGKIMDANGGPLATPAQSEMQFLLMVHQPFDERLNFFFIVGYAHVSDECTVDDWSNGREFCVNGHGDAAGLDAEVG